MRSLPQVAISILHSLILYEDEHGVPVSCWPLLEAPSATPLSSLGYSSAGQQKDVKAAGKQNPGQGRQISAYKYVAFQKLVYKLLV